jgi:RimJ/RimL family protein N-acetyltransferase
MHLDQWLLAVDRASGLAAGGAALERASLEVGGWLAPRFRGRGLGAELFVAIAQFGHDHLGISTLRAGTEPTNTACVAVLLAAGFKPAPGPQTHRLPDGRVVPSRWFCHETARGGQCQG